MPTAALEGDPESALDEFFSQAFGGAIGYSDSILEIVMDAELPSEEREDESTEEAKDEEKSIEKCGEAKRDPKGSMTPTALTLDYSLDGLDIQSEVPLEQLDPAVMRRFTFKVRMGALDDDGKVKFFRRYFKSTLTADERRRLVSIPNLTPGDFRTVRERLYFLGKKKGSGNERLLSALEVESAVKNGARAPIGFVR